MADATNQGNAPVDPVTGFWRDMWARYAAAAGSMPGMGAAGGATGDSPFGQGAFFSPDAMRRMQNSYFEAMAKYAEDYMKTPQFLESMKRSMDQALAFRQQMDGFLKSNMASAFEAASGGANTEVLGAIRQLSARIDERLTNLEARLSALEGAAGLENAAAPAKPGKRAAKH
ncbi:MAG: hypothetical protein JNM94_08910 [Phycisphaerae bacterium]|nr:hypothetical protein [Phycisphaerae bacterium]